MKKFILQKVSPKSPSSSSPNSAEINEEKQENDDSLPNQQPRPSLQEFSFPRNPFQEIPNPQNPNQETTNPYKRKRPETVDKFYEQRKRPRKSELEEMSAKPLGISLDSIPTYKPRISGMESAEDCILFASTSTSEEDDDVKTMKYVMAFLGRGKFVPQSWSHYQALSGFLVDFGERVSIEVLEKKLDKLKNKFFMAMDRLRLYPSSLLTEYDRTLYRFGNQVWGDELRLKNADREITEMYPGGFDYNADGEVEQENAQSDAIHKEIKAKKKDDCLLFERSISEEEDDVKMMRYVREHVEGGNPFPQCMNDYNFLCGVIRSYGESISPGGLEKKLNTMKSKFFSRMELLVLYPEMTLSEYDDHLQKFGNEYWGGSELDDLAHGSYSMDGDTMEYHNAELDAMYARNREIEKAELLPMMPQKEANQGQEEDCILFEGLKSEEDDDITTMECFQAYVQDEHTSFKSSTSEEDLRRLYMYITNQGSRIKLELLRQKVTKLRKKYSMLRDRMRYYEEMCRLGEVVWDSRMFEESPSGVGAYKVQHLQFGESRGNQPEFGKLSQKKTLENLNQNELRRQQQEVEVALRQLYGMKSDEWAREYKKKVEAILMDDEMAKPNKRDQGQNEKFREKCATLFYDDWEVAEDCILFTRSKSEEEDDVMTLNCVIAYIHQKTDQVADDFEVLYGLLISKSLVCISSLEVLKMKLAKLLSKYLMLMERIRLYSRINWTEHDDSLHRLGTLVWGSRMLEGTFPLLDSSSGIGITDQENPTIAEMRAAARRHHGRRFRISQDLTVGRNRIIIRPPSVSTSVDDAFDSRPAINPNRELVIRETGKPADDRPPEAVPDVKCKGKQAPTETPTKFQRVEQLLLLFQGAKNEVEDDLILLRYASAYGRNVTSPTVAGLYEFILVNLPTGEGISWFLLKLKMTMLEMRYLGVLDTNGNMEDFDMAYYRELYRLGRQFWGDEIVDQNPDGNMRTRGASGSCQ